MTLATFARSCAVSTLLISTIVPFTAGQSTAQSTPQVKIYNTAKRAP